MTSNGNGTAKAHIICLLTALMWGTSFLSTKVLLDVWTSEEVLLYRFVLAYIFLVMVSPKPYRKISWISELWFALAGFSGVALYFLFENTALQYTYASNVSVIVSAAPLFTAILSFIYLKNERPKLPFYVGFVLAMTGIVMITVMENGLDTNVFGNVLALLSAVVWAIYSVIVKRKLELPGSMIAITRRILFYGLLTSVPVCLVMGYRFDQASVMQVVSSPVYLAHLLFLSLGASSFGYVMWNYGVKKLGAVKASAYIYLVPAITVIVGVSFFSEPFTLVLGFGLVLTVLGLVYSERKTIGFTKKK